MRKYDAIGALPARTTCCTSCGLLYYRLIAEHGHGKKGTQIVFPLLPSACLLDLSVPRHLCVYKNYRILSLECITTRFTDKRQAALQPAREEEKRKQQFTTHRQTTHTPPREQEGSKKHAVHEQHVAAVLDDNVAVVQGQQEHPRRGGRHGSLQAYRHAEGSHGVHAHQAGCKCPAVSHVVNRPYVWAA